MGRFSLLLPVVLIVSGTGIGDEAVRKNGTSCRGTLSLNSHGCFTFESDGAKEAISEFDLIRFSSKRTLNPTIGLFQHQVRLIRGQVLQGELLKLEEEHLHLRTTWGASLAIACPLIERVTNLPGIQPILFDDFSTDLSRWKVAGEPGLADGKLLFSKAGQSIEATFRNAIASGRIDVRLRAGRSKSRQVALVLGFDDKKQSDEIRVELMGPNPHWSVVSLIKATHAGKIERDEQAHRLNIEFTSNGLSVFVDDLVLWSQSATNKPLKSVAIISTGDGSESVAIEDILVCKNVPAIKRRAVGDRTVDAVRSIAGDETFGRLVRVGSNGVQLNVLGKPAATSWPELSEFAFRRARFIERATTGEQVQVRLRPVHRSQDILEGAVKSLDDRYLTLSHASLGDLRLPRECIEELRLRFHGKVIPVDSTPRHLGSRAGFGFAVPKPEGMSFKKTVQQPPYAKGFIAVDAARIASKGPQVELLVDGKSLGKLNDQVDRADANVRTFRVPIARGLSGETEIEIRVLPNAEGRKEAGIDLRAVRLEIVEPR